MPENDASLDDLLALTQDTPKEEHHPEPPPEQTEKEPEAPENPDILIHFVADGKTAFGQVWYRGQELVVTPEMYESTKNDEGVSWIDADEYEQVEKYGHVKFRKGPWRGKEWEDEAAAEAEKRRDRRAPKVRT